jgi:hypothetical protein
MFGRQLEEPDRSLPLPTGSVSKPLDLSGWLYGRTLIASDGSVQSRELGEVVGRKAGPKDPMPIPAISEDFQHASARSRAVDRLIEKHVGRR